MEEKALAVGRQRREVIAGRGVERRTKVHRRRPRFINRLPERSPKVLIPNASRPIRRDDNLEAIESNAGRQVVLRRAELTNQRGWLEQPSHDRADVDVQTSETTRSAACDI